MLVRSAVLDRHTFLEGDLARLANHPDATGEVAEALKAARAHNRAVLADPLAHGSAGGGEDEQAAALVSSAHAEAMEEVLAQHDAKNPLKRLYARIEQGLHVHSLATPAEYGDLDARWLEALVHRLENRKAGLREFPSREHVAALPMANRTKIAILGDWGTGLPESDLIAAHAMQVRPDITIHLGDVYYAGGAHEERRFAKRWVVGSAIVPGTEPPVPMSFTLNSNHEMYSGGDGYFDEALTSLKFRAQAGLSYFALTNDAFLILGLDSAFHAGGLYQKGDLGAVQTAFIAGQVAAAKTKQIIVLTHHNGLGLDNQPIAPLWQQVTEAIAAGAGPIKKPFTWIWGHLHAAVAHPDVDGARGRCVGHGGIPYIPFTKTQRETYQWAETKYAHDARELSRALNGFYVLSLDDGALEETFYDERGRRRWPNPDEPDDVND